MAENEKHHAVVRISGQNYMGAEGSIEDFPSSVLEEQAPVD